MRILVALILILLVQSPAPADAGAWPRERGTWFVSSDMRLSWHQDATQRVSLMPVSQYYTLYAEYGLPRNLTAGLDLGRSVSGAGKTIAFLRLPVYAPESGLKVALDLGLGQIEARPVMRPGLSLGFAFAALGRKGWLSADAIAEIAPVSQHTDYKLDLTFGVDLESGTKVILQIQTGAPDGFAAFARFAPSLVMHIGRNRLLDMGVMYGLEGDDTFGVKLGVWQTF